MNDAALLRRALKGHEASFSELFARYQRRIHQYGSQMCGAAAGDDIVQETFLAMLRSVGFDASRGTVTAYRFGIARHHVIKRLATLGDPLIEPSDPRVLKLAAAQDWWTAYGLARARCPLISGRDDDDTADTRRRHANRAARDSPLLP